MLRSDKGQKVFIEAAKLILNKRDDIIFFIIGGTTDFKKNAYQQNLETRLDEDHLSDHIIMTGFRSDVHKFMALADIYVNASTGVEARPQTIPQAFASKVAVVGTTVGGIPDLITHEHTGLLIPPKDPHAMSEAVLKLLENKMLFVKCIEEGYKESKNLSFTTTMKLIIEVYIKALK